jgi:hypothetical protein
MHTTNVRRTLVAMAATAAVLGGVAACGGGGGSSDSKAGGSRTAHQDNPGQSAAQVSLAALQRVETRTEKAESAKVTGSMELGTTSMTMDGALDWSDHLTGNLAMTQKNGALAQLGGGGKMLAVYTPDSMYVNMGPEVAKKTGGKHWIKYDYDDLARYAGASGDVMRDQIQNNNPTQSVRMLLASGDVKKVGTETIGSDRTTHYAGNVDVADFTEKSSKTLTKEQLDEFKRQLQQSGVTTEHIDIWVNGDDLLVKKIESAHTTQGDLKATAYYTDYGTPVRVQAPPLTDTADFTDLMNKAG